AVHPGGGWVRLAWSREGLGVRDCGKPSVAVRAISSFPTPLSSLYESRAFKTKRSAHGTLATRFDRKNSGLVDLILTIPPFCCVDPLAHLFDGHVELAREPFDADDGADHPRGGHALTTGRMSGSSVRVIHWAGYQAVMPL